MWCGTAVWRWTQRDTSSMTEVNNICTQKHLHATQWGDCDGKWQARTVNCGLSASTSILMSYCASMQTDKLLLGSAMIWRHVKCLSSRRSCSHLVSLFLSTAVFSSITSGFVQWRKHFAQKCPNGLCLFAVTCSRALRTDTERDDKKGGGGVRGWGGGQSCCALMSSPIVLLQK